MPDPAVLVLPGPVVGYLPDQVAGFRRGPVAVSQQAPVAASQLDQVVAFQPVRGAASRLGPVAVSQQDPEAVFRPGRVAVSRQVPVAACQTVLIRGVASLFRATNYPRNSASLALASGTFASNSCACAIGSSALIQFFGRSRLIRNAARSCAICFPASRNFSGSDFDRS